MFLRQLRHQELGGTMTVSDICFPGLFFAWGKQIIDGPCFEAVKRTIELGGGTMPEISFKPKRHWFEQISMNSFVFTSVLFKMCDEAGIKTLCNAMLSDITENADGVFAVATDKDGLFSVNAKCVVDTTGDANLVKMAGYAVEKSEVQQPATLENRISGYNVEDVSLDEIKEKFSGADLPEGLCGELLMNFLRANRLNIHIPSVDSDTSEGKTATEKNAYYDYLKVYNFYRGIKGLENIQISYTATETGIRETNRIVGEDTVSSEDYINGRFYDDSVCYAFYPVDRHVQTGIEQVFHEENVVSKVPYGALVPKGAKRIICAGRCISADTYANSALRVEAVCMATGQAAGVAAAIVSKRDCDIKAVPYNELCESLEKIGAIIPKKD